MRWAIAFVTMDRPVAAQRFVRSARRQFPDVPIYVADQSAALEPMAEFYAAERVTLIRMPYDSGVSACRNALVEAMDVDYFALCDDDFVLGPATAFASAIAVLEADDTLGVVGGLLHDYDGSVERVRNWEMFLDRDERHGRFTAIPIYHYSPSARSVAGETVYACDAVLNFAVCRRALFSPEIRWDDRIKINGEHEDFYLTLKTRSNYLVAYLPRMAALHHPVDLHGHYARLRSREAGWAEFMRKWHLTAHLEVGTGGRPLDGSQVADWFDAGDESGPFRSRLGVVARHRSAAEATAGADPYASFTSWLIPEVSTSSPVAAGRLSFCYQPLADPDGALLLWYRVEHDVPGLSDNGGIVARWFSSTSEVLAWDSDALPVRGAEARYWQPLAVRLPVWPRDADYLRFELVSAGRDRGPLAVGYVFADRAAADRAAPLPTVSARALARTTAAAVGVNLPPQPLAVLVAAAMPETITVPCHDDTGLAMLDMAGLDFLVIAAEPPWPALYMAVAPGDAHAPTRVAVPVELIRAPGTVLLACRPGRAHERLTVLEPRLAPLEPPSGQ